MEKYRLRISYKVGGELLSSNAAETEHYSIETYAKANHIKLIFNAKQELEITDFRVIVPHFFSSEDRIFANGYQSWTDCREMFPDEVPQHTNALEQLVLSNTMLGASGTYSFAKPRARKGEFTGYSYLYVRNGSTYNLFASLSERSGYTLITADYGTNTVTFKKDVDGVKISGSYEILDAVHLVGAEDEVFDKWFAAMGVEKPRAKLMNGYTTWYNYYSKITEQIVSDDLEALSKVDADVDIFQIDDGFQTGVGDWLSIIEKKFPGGMKAQADKIHSKNMLAGLWLAPLGAKTKSTVAKEHPDWLIKHPNGKPVQCGPNWGGFYSLDIEIPEVRDYIKNFFNVILNDWGFDLVKLDFLYCCAIIPYHNKSRGQLMCEAMDFLRECVGDKYILGCGVPLMPAFGKVDYCRIGADMDLVWNKPTFNHREFISTVHTLGNSIFRRQLNGRAFLNDTDVFLLRDNNIHMNFEQKEIIATVNKLCGSVIFTSDNVDKYNDKQMELLLKTFSKDDIKITSAAFRNEERSVIDIDYTLNGEEKHFAFDIKRGKAK